MTVSRLRTELTDAELVHFAAYFEVKAEREEKALERAKRQRRETFLVAVELSWLNPTSSSG